MPQQPRSVYFGAPRTSLGMRRAHLHFQQKSTSDDGMGGQVVTWPTVGHAWARMTALDERSRESLAALQIQGRAAYHADIAYRSGITADMRVTWEGKTLEVQSVQDDTGRKRRLLLLCTEVQ